MISYDTAFDLSQKFFLFALPPILLAVLVWRFTSPKYRLGKIILALFAGLAGLLLGFAPMSLAPRLGNLIPASVTSFFILFSLPFLVAGLVGWLVLAVMKAPARKAALGALTVFAVPYAGLLIVYLLQLNHATPYWN